MKQYAVLLGMGLGLVACNRMNGREDVQGVEASVEASLADVPGSSDGGDGAVPPNVSEVLAACGEPLSTGTYTGGVLQRIETDARVFPNAICNDGSRSAMYYRPYRGAANQNKWLILVHGGGGCASGDSCAVRWCGCRNATQCPHGDPETSPQCSISSTWFPMAHLRSMPTAWPCVAMSHGPIP